MYKASDKIKKDYKALYDSLTIEHPEYRVLFTTRQVPLVNFTAIEGHRYSKNRIKFMLIGRAVNGWNEYCPFDKELLKDAFVDSAIKNLNNESVALSDKNSKDRFEWIDNDGRNTFRSRIDTNKAMLEMNPYSVKRTPFWNYACQIWAKLTKQEDMENLWRNRWYENIVWSNLYKVAPSFGGNPDENLKKAQLESCRALLKDEIDYFQPTHILFETDYEWWFDKFEDLFEATKITDQFVKSKGIYVGDGFTSMFVVAVRPEMRNKTSYINSVLRQFDANHD